MQAFKGRTVFFITHRLATIRNADTILMMDKGAIAEQGTHNELMSQKGQYYCLFMQQDPRDRTMLLKNSQPSLNALLVKPSAPQFDQSLTLPQSGKLTQYILWTLMTLTALSIGWALIAQIEESIQVQGKLEPEGTVKNVQVQINGVVKAIAVKDGQTVKKGDLLLSLDRTITNAQLESLQNTKRTLEQETQFYQSQLNGNSNVPTISIAPQMFNLTQSRAAIIADTRLIRA